MTHWTTYLKPFQPCLEGLTCARRSPTIAHFWRTCPRQDWLMFLWLAVAFNDDAFNADLEWFTKQCGGTWYGAENTPPAVWDASTVAYDSVQQHPFRIRELLRAPTLLELKAASKRARKALQ